MVSVLSVLAKQLGMSNTTMKKTPVRSNVKKRAPSLLREYRFDYSKAKPNRFAARMTANTVAVVLDPDVASVFSSPQAVNTLLRSVMSAMPKESAR
jgi:hypothetical protein